MLSEEEERIVQVTRGFVEEAFQANPHYSFNDWTVMYDHSCIVETLARTIARSAGADEFLVRVGALLHDIGKTHQADHETLHQQHESFNLPVAENLLDTFLLPSARLEQLKRLVSYADESVEMRVIKDADALALPSDKRLYMLFIEWAHERKLEDSIKRKLDKFAKLNFDISRGIGEPLFQAMKQDWEEYRQLHV